MMMINLSPRSFLFVVISILFLHSVSSVVLPTNPNPNANYGRKVFAHYMLCCPTYNGSVEGFKQEIIDAHSFGIDGFALNAGGWENTNYRSTGDMIYQAAHELSNLNFKLFFSADMTGIYDPNDIKSMVASYYNHSAQLKMGNASVFSSYEGGNLGYHYWKPIFNDLNANNMSVFFVPSFSDVYGYRDSMDGFEWNYEAFQWSEMVDGLFYFAIAGSYVDYRNGYHLGVNGNALPIVIQGNVAVAKSNGKLGMASISPVYWGAKQYGLGRRYYDYQGARYLHDQFEVVIEQSNADWIEIITWNDLDEAGYICPLNYDINPWVFDFSKYRKLSGYPDGISYYPKKNGLNDLLQYYIQWFKSKTKPVLSSDSAYWFYRKHPQDASAYNETGNDWVFSKGCLDDLYVTTMLVKPALITVSISNISIIAPAGVSNHNFPMVNFGFPVITVRDLSTNNVILTGTGLDEYVQVPQFFNFHYSTGSAHGSAYSFPLPSPIVSSAGDDNMTSSVSWTAVNGATSYSVKISDKIEGPFVAVATGVSQLTYTVTNLVNMQYYYVVVSAKNSANQESYDSIPVRVQPNTYGYLKVIDIDFTGEPNTMAVIKALVKNVGNYPVEFGIHATIDATYAYSDASVLVYLEPGQTNYSGTIDYYHFAPNFYNLTRGTHVVTMVPKYTSNIPSFYKDYMAKTININPDYVIPHLNFTKLNTTHLVVQVTISNIGVLEANDSINGNFYFNNQWFDSFTFTEIISINGSRIVTSVPVELQDGGIYSADVNILPMITKFVTEESYTNNQVSQSYVEPKITTGEVTTGSVTTGSVTSSRITTGWSTSLSSTPGQSSISLGNSLSLSNFLIVFISFIVLFNL